MKDKKYISILVLIFFSILFIAYKVGTYDKNVEKINNTNATNTATVSKRIFELENQNKILTDKIDKLIDNKASNDSFEQLYNIIINNFDGKKVNATLQVIPKIVADNMKINIFDQNSNIYNLSKEETGFISNIDFYPNNIIPMYANVEGVDLFLLNSIGIQETQSINNVNRVFNLTPTFEGKKIQENSTFADLLFDKLRVVYTNKKIDITENKLKYDLTFTFNLIKNFRKSNFINHKFIIEKNGEKILEENLSDDKFQNNGVYSVIGSTECQNSDKINLYIKSTNDKNDVYLINVANIENSLNTIDGQTLIKIFVDDKQVSEYNN